MKRFLSAVLLATFAHASAAAIIVHTTDFINDATRGGFNGFESIPNNGTIFTGAFPYVEDGIAVEQVNGQGPGDIWVTCGTECFDPAPQGTYSWYPDGGDSGYTKITRSNGSDFSGVGFLTGSGWRADPTRTRYVLLDGGSIVLEGFIDKTAGNVVTYLGFSGGGFDEIRVYDHLASSENTANALALDSIEIDGSVPEPGMLALIGLSLGALGLARRRKQ